MEYNIINKLAVQLNNHIYNKNEIFATLGIKFGFCTKKVFLVSQNEVKNLNTSCADIFINYIDVIMKERYNIYKDKNQKEHNASLGINASGSIGDTGGLEFDISRMKALDWGVVNLNVLHFKIGAQLGLGFSLDVSIPEFTIDMPWEN